MARHHRGARSHVDQRGPGRPFLEAADEHGEIGALSAAVGMQLVEHEEAQPAGGAVEDRLVLEPDQHQLGHHVVGQQDMWRLAPNGVALFG